MSEITLAEAKLLAELFAQQYNAKNNTTFIWTDNSFLANAGQVPDFVLFDGDLELKVQHTRAFEDEEYLWKSKHKHVDSRLRDALAELSGHGLKAYLAFCGFPRTDDLLDSLVDSVIALAKSKSKQRQDYSFYAEPIINGTVKASLEPWLVELRLTFTDDEVFDLYVSPWRCGKEVETNNLQRVTNAVMNKSSMPVDNILLVDLDDKPFNENLSLEHIRQAIVEFIPEVWLATRVTPNPRAIFVKNSSK